MLHRDAPDPAVGQENEINLDAHAKQILKKKGQPFDDGRPLEPDPHGAGILGEREKLRRRIEQGLGDGGHRAEQNAAIDEPAP